MLRRAPLPALAVFTAFVLGAIVIVAFAIMFVSAPDLTRSNWRLRSPTPGAEAGGNTAGPAVSA